MNELKRAFSLIFFLICIQIGYGFNSDSIFLKNLKSVCLHRLGNPMSEPFIGLHSGEQLELVFDIMGTEAPFLNYALIHCNAHS